MSGRVDHFTFAYLLRSWRVEVGVIVCIRMKYGVSARPLVLVPSVPCVQTDMELKTVSKESLNSAVPSGSGAHECVCSVRFPCGISKFRQG